MYRRVPLFLGDACCIIGVKCLDVFSSLLLDGLGKGKCLTTEKQHKYIKKVNLMNLA